MTPTAIPIIAFVVRPGTGTCDGSVVPAVVGGATRGSTVSVRFSGKASGFCCSIGGVAHIITQLYK